MLYFTILRHGETVGNVARCVQSRTGGELTEKGKLMAQNLGELMQDEVFSHIMSSDLKRCVDTTANLVSKLKCQELPPVQYLPILREKDFGDWEGQVSTVAWDKRLELGLPIHKTYVIDCPNGETFKHCKERTGRFFADILKLAEEVKYEGNVLAVSHGNWIACFLEYLLENPVMFELVNFEDDDLKRRFANTARTRFSIEKIEKTSPSFRLTFSHVFDEEHLKNINA